MVLFYHYGPMLGLFPAGTILAKVQRIALAGWTGVDLFFVLSGFLIAGILIDNRQSPSYYRTFYIRRVCRIFPVYYLLLFAYTAALATGTYPRGSSLFIHPLPTWSYYFFLQNNFMAVVGDWGAAWLGITWSLAIEEQFYLILPAVIHRFGSPRNLLKIAGLFIVIGPLSRAMVTYGLHVQNWTSNYCLLTSRCDELGVGILVAILYRSKDGWRKITGARWPAIAAGATAIVVPTAVIFGFSQEHNFFLSYTFIACFYALLLIGTIVSDNPLSKLLSVRLMRTFGNMSYSTYLFHPIVLRLSFYMFHRGEPHVGSWHDVPPVGVALVATLLFSWMSWSFIERPILSFGHRFKYSPVERQIKAAEMRQENAECLR